jgi:ribosomal protein S7
MRNKAINHINVWVNMLLKNGGKEKYEKVMFRTFRLLKKKGIKIIEKNKVFKEVNLKVRPVVELKSKKISGKIYNIPRYVNSRRGLYRGVRWILTDMRMKKKIEIEELIIKNILEIRRGEGLILRKKREIEKEAINKKPYITYY